MERKAAREQQYALNQERKKLEREGDVEVRNRVRELEAKLASLMKEFEFQMRENVRAIEDRAAQQKLSKEAERRIQRLRREFQESFNQTVVAHRTGADQGDANAQPHVLRHIAPGDQVRIKSMNKIAVVQREIEKDLFEVALGPIKMRVKRDDCSARFRFGGDAGQEKADPLAAARKQKGVHVSVTSANTDEMRMEINLIGRTVDEATEELEKYLDRAFLAGLRARARDSRPWRRNSAARGARVPEEPSACGGDRRGSAKRRRAGSHAGGAEAVDYSASVLTLILICHPERSKPRLLRLAESKDLRLLLISLR